MSMCEFDSVSIFKTIRVYRVVHLTKEIYYFKKKKSEHS